MERKSQRVNIGLVLVFGPLGLFYASVWQAFVLLLCAVFVMVLPAPINLYGLGVIWLLALAVGMSAVSARNKKIDQQEAVDERRHQELIAATREAAR